MGLMDDQTTPTLAKRKRPPARPDPERWLASLPPRPANETPEAAAARRTAGLAAVGQRPPQPMTDAQLLRPEGAAGQAYDRRLLNEAPGGMAAAGARANPAAALLAQPERTVQPAIEWQPDLMKQIVAQNNAVRGIAPGQAGTVDYTAPNLFSYGEQQPGGARGRYVGPGAIRPDAAGQALVAGPDLATQRRMLPLQQEVAQGQTGLLQTQAAGQMAAMAPALMQQGVAGQQQAQAFERLQQIAEMYTDPADKQRIGQLAEAVHTGQPIPETWWPWLKKVLGEQMLNYLQRVMGKGPGGGGGY